MTLQSSEISANIADAIAGLDLDNELLGSTEGDDGVDVLVGKNTAPVDDKTVDPAPVAPAAVVAAGTTAPSKADLARVIFNREYPRVLKGETRRCDVIKLFVSQAGLTDKGAGTYYQNFVTKAKAAATLAAGATATATATATVEPTDGDNEADDSAE